MTNRYYNHNERGLTMQVRDVETAREVIKACKFGTKQVRWIKLSEGERMILRDAFIFLNYHNGEKLPAGVTNGSMEISRADRSDINWVEILGDD